MEHLSTIKLSAIYRKCGELRKVAEEKGYILNMTLTSYEWGECTGASISKRDADGKELIKDLPSMHTTGLQTESGWKWYLEQLEQFEQAVNALPVYEQGQVAEGEGVNA